MIGFLLALAAFCHILALADGSQTCADATRLLPFVTQQLTQGDSLIVFQGAAAPQVSSFYGVVSCAV